MIRKSISSILIVACAVTPLSAQVTVGIEVAGVSSNPSVKPDTTLPNQSARFGFAAGVSAVFPITHGLSFAPEAQYIQKGAKATLTTGGATLKENLKITSYEIPVLLRWSPAGKSHIHPYLTAGPEFSFHQKCSSHIVVTGVVSADTTEDCGSTATHGTTTSDMGIIAGAGFSSGKLSLSARYDYGLKDIRKDPAVGEDAKNRAFMLVLGISM